MGLGIIFHERNLDKMKRVESEIEDFIEMHFSNEQSYSNFVFEVSVSSIEKKLGNSMLNDDSS